MNDTDQQNTQSNPLYSTEEWIEAVENGDLVEIEDLIYDDGENY